MTPIGRRRQALLRQAAEQRLDQRDLELLQQDPSPAVRAEIAGRLGRQLDLPGTEGEQETARVLLDRLAQDTATDVRRRLASAVAGSPHLPAEMARRLGADTIEVARPLLESSPVLDDRDLIGIVTTGSAAHALAIADRAELSESLVEALVATGREAVIVRVIDNPGARLSPAVIATLVAQARSSGTVQDRLLRRADLPLDLVGTLVDIVAERLEWPAVRERRMPAGQVLTFAAMIRERVALGDIGASFNERNLHAQMHARWSSGQLTHEAILYLLRDGVLAGVEMGLSLHSRLAMGQVRRLLYDPDRQHMAALCIAAGLAPAHYLVLRTPFDLVEEALADQSGPDTDRRPESLRYQHVHYEKLRTDEPRLHMLLDTFGTGT